MFFISALNYIFGHNSFSMMYFALMTMMVDDKPGKARGSLRDFSVEAFPNESGSENRSGSDTPKLQNIKSNTKLIQIQIQHL